MKAKDLLIIFLLIVTVSENIFSQKLKIGPRIELGFLSTEYQGDNSVLFSPYGFYLTTKYQPLDFLSFELRPGIFLAGEYSSYEIGGFMWIQLFQSNWSLISGLNNHSNIINTTHNSGGSYSKDILYSGVGFGFQTDKKLIVDIMFYWTSNKNYAYGYSTDATGNLIRHEKNIESIIKISFCLTWDL
ncbi:MAG: hypothetical protein GYA14_11595 [Ignavibacteria bacterium]|nr:hypothetical protein [Ignavibacteria bacterium]